MTSDRLVFLAFHMEVQLANMASQFNQSESSVHQIIVVIQFKIQLQI